MKASIWLQSLFDSKLDDRPIVFDPPAWVSIVVVITFTCTIGLAIFIYFSPILAALLALVAVISLLAWLRNGYAYPITRRILPLYIIVVVVNLLHGAEQYKAGYVSVLKQLFPVVHASRPLLTDTHYTVVFSLLSSTLLLLGAAGIFYQTRLGSYIAWLGFIGCLLFPCSHFILSLISGHWIYLPGMMMAPVLMSLSMMGIHGLLFRHPTGIEQ